MRIPPLGIGFQLAMALATLLAGASWAGAQNADNPTWRLFQHALDQSPNRSVQ